MRRRDPVEQKFLLRMQAHCAANGIKIQARPRKFVGSAKQKCGGYFDGDTVVIASGAPRWFETLLHEYGHVCQKLDGSWFTGRTETMLWNSFDNWIMHRNEVSESRTLLATRTIQRCELDCERRTVELMRAHKFTSVNVDRYIRCANAYVWSYEAARLTRKWSNRRRPYRVPEISVQMPSRLISEKELGSLPEGYLEAYVRECVKR